MFFRNSDTLRNEEKWFFNDKKVKIAFEFNYLGVVFTPKLKFSNRLKKRNAQGKNALNLTWKTLMDKQQINLPMNWKVYLAVCRAIQSYAAQL